ncbi:MAG: hypothetical protein ACRBBP_00720 [Bdellovibrionales bacterium]
MKYLILTVSLFFSLNLFAASSKEKKPEKLVFLEGTAPDGSPCTYQVNQMKNWEQEPVVIFLNGENGNFRIELDSVQYSKGKLAPLYPKGSTLSYSNGDLVSVVKATEEGDLDKEARISFKAGGLETPSMAIASGLAEQYACMF